MRWKICFARLTQLAETKETHLKPNFVLGCWENDKYERGTNREAIGVKRV